MAKLWFLNGFFWQAVQGLGISMVPIEGAVPIIRHRVCPFYFGAQIYTKGGDVFAGEMFDLHGRAELSNIVLTEVDLQFTKLYDRYAGDPLHEIEYTFEYSLDGWVGHYRLPVLDVRGPARCYVTENADPEAFEADGEQFYAEWQKNIGRSMRRPNPTGVFLFVL